MSQIKNTRGKDYAGRNLLELIICVGRITAGIGIWL